MEHEDASSQHDTTAGWVNTRQPQSHSWNSDSSEDYVVMTIRKNKKEYEFEVAGLQSPLENHGKTTMAWIVSGSPTSIFTIVELRKKAGESRRFLLPLGPNDDLLRDYRNNPLKIRGR